jgi:limonene-1,2-epoxide hydrolase
MRMPQAGKTRDHRPVRRDGAREDGERVTTTSTAAANDALVREFIAAWERRDTDFIVDHFTEDGVYHSMPLTPIVGWDAIRDWVASFASKPPGRLNVLNQVASDDVVMNERLDSIMLNGKLVELPIMGVFEIEDARIKAWREYFDLGPARAAYEEQA